MAKLLILLGPSGIAELIGKLDSALAAPDHARNFAPCLSLLFLGAAFLEKSSSPVDRIQPVQVRPKSVSHARPSFRTVPNASDQGSHNGLNCAGINRPQSPDNR